MENFRLNLIHILWEYPHSICLAFIGAMSVLAFFLGFPIRRKVPCFPSSQPLLLTSRTIWVYWMFGLFLGVFAAIIPAGEAMTWYDSNIFFSTLSGKQFYPSPIWPGSGRFFPLAHQEFQFLSHINATFQFYHIFSSFELIIICGILLLWARSIPVWGVITIIGIVTTPAIIMAFSEIIYPERNMLVLLLLIILSSKIWYDRGFLFGLIAATASAAALILYKETSIIILGVGSAITFLKIFYENRKDYRQRLLIWSSLQALICITWLVVYFGLIMPSVTARYAAAENITYISAITSFIAQPWSWLLLVLCIIRLQSFFKNGKEIDAVWDSVLLSSILYSAAIIVLRFVIPYYTAPAAFMTWLYALNCIRKNKAIFINYFTVILVLVQFPITVHQIENQKEIVDAKAQATAYLAAMGSIQYQPMRLHFPQSNRYEAGLMSGLLLKEYDVSSIAGIAFSDIDSDFSDCTSDIHVPCADHMILGKDDFIVGLGAQIKNPGLKLIFTSQPIGFWKNRYFVFIYKKQ